MSVLELNQSLEVAEAEGTGAAAFRDDQLIAVVRLLPRQGQDVFPSTEVPQRQQTTLTGVSSMTAVSASGIAGNSGRNPLATGGVPFSPSRARPTGRIGCPETGHIGKT